MGLVKNRCKNGDHYWVDAFVTPVKGDKGDDGFQSVRVKPAREAVQRAEQFYQSLNAGGSGLPWYHLKLSLFTKTSLAALASVLMGGFGIALSGTALSTGIILSLCVLLLFNVGVVFAISRPWAQAAKDAGNINDMSMQIATAAEEQSQVSAEINKNIVNINDSATQTHQGCQRVNSASTDLNASIGKLNQMITQFTV